MKAKLLTVFLSCAKEAHLWAGWAEKHKLTNAGSDYIILCGDTMLQEDYVVKTDCKNKFTVLYLKCPDTYENLPHKMICAFHAIYNCDIFNEYSHIWKCDPIDTWNNQGRLDKVFDHINYEEKGSEPLDYGGKKLGPGIKQDREYHYGKVTPNSYWDDKPYGGSYKDYILGGSDNGAAGYILSRKSLHCITNYFHPHQREVIYAQHIYEDLMLSLILDKFSIKPVVLWY